jgi:hypothetical protein
MGIRKKDGRRERGTFYLATAAARSELCVE